MQDKDFDRFIQQAFENQPEPEYNPADWDKLEDRLHNLNAAQPNAAGTSAGAGVSKLGFVASAILVTALNVVFLAKPELVKNVINSEEKIAASATVQPAETPEEVAADKTRTYAEEGVIAEGKATTNQPSENATAIRDLPAVALQNAVGS